MASSIPIGTTTASYWSALAATLVHRIEGVLSRNSVRRDDFAPSTIAGAQRFFDLLLAAPQHAAVMIDSAYVAAHAALTETGALSASDSDADAIEEFKTFMATISDRDLTVDDITTLRRLAALFRGVYRRGEAEDDMSAFRDHDMSYAFATAM